MKRACGGRRKNGLWSSCFGLTFLVSIEEPQYAGRRASSEQRMTGQLPNCREENEAKTDLSEIQELVENAQRKTRGNTPFPSLSTLLPLCVCLAGVPSSSSFTCLACFFLNEKPRNKHPALAPAFALAPNHNRTMKANGGTTKATVFFPAVFLLTTVVTLPTVPPSCFSFLLFAKMWQTLVASFLLRFHSRVAGNNVHRPSISWVLRKKVEANEKQYDCIVFFFHPAS